MHEKFDWREGAPMPYGDRDKPELVVSGPARRRAEERKEIKMSLMNQPHNKTDRLAYCKGDVLKELHAEQKSGRVSKGEAEERSDKYVKRATITCRSRRSQLLILALRI